ncbi:NADP-dependent oxidoreductase [Nocardia sp. NPDC051570]|uniref:NADP-dependent oxidoreductase n=1 Tax=Nocardia sp. NPDC051570 TaxID=3364324 RepID=UPI003792C79D
MTVKAAAIQLVSRPIGAPTTGNFTTVDVEIGSPRPGQALVENVYLSVDPYMRELMHEGWEFDTFLEGRAIGRIIESADPRLTVGDWVSHRRSWRTHALVTADEIRVLPGIDGLDVTNYLGALGGTGLTAYIGLTRIARVQPGETVFISAAAGGVGVAAGQLARLLGAHRVVGSTGSARKAQYLTRELGFDAAFDYRDGDLPGQLAEAAPDGIDIYFDNVGGDHLEAAIGSMREHGRIAFCGAVAQYNDLSNPPSAPRNLFDLVERSIRLEGFMVRDYYDVQPELEQFLIPHILAGRVRSPHTIVDGFDRMIEAFVGMLQGENLGKMIVRAAAA